MSDYQFESVWRQPSDAVKAEVVNFWLDEAAMVEGIARERVEQLLMVCRNEVDGPVVGVSTAVPFFVERLGLRLFYFRAFVGRRHRTRGLRASRVIQQLIRRSYDVLNERFGRGDSDVVGLYLEVQNTNVLRRRRELVWTDLGANIFFAGVQPGGGEVRVWYFENASLHERP